jgi:hypothetical protein
MVHKLEQKQLKQISNSLAILMVLAFTVKLNNMKYTIFTISLFFAFSAQSQQAFLMKKADAQVDLLLDTHTSQTAFILRKLSSTYAGSAIQVRRASDNSTQNIGFSSSGDLDESALTSFCAATDCFVSIWYDQSGNSLDATQTTNTKQPKIVSSGVVETENLKPTIIFDGSDDELEVGTVSSFNYLHDGTSSSVINVSKYADISNEALFGNNKGATSQVGFSVFYKTTNKVSSFCSTGSAEVIYNESAATTDILSQHLLFTTIDADNTTPSNRSIMSINDAADFSNNTTSNSPSTSDASQIMTIGNSGKTANNYFEGNVQELIFYNTDKTSSKADIKSNINTYYSIY